MRRFFVLFSFLLVCAVGFADQPWEDVSVFAPSFKSCLIQANESNLAFQAVLGDESFYFKVGKDDEKAFLDLINSDHSLSDKKRVIDNYIMTAVTVHRDGCTVTKLANGNSSNTTYHVTLEDRHRRDAAAEKERQDEASASRVARSKPAARDWDIPGMGDGVSRQMASSSRHKENPATRDWQLPSERSGEPDRTGIFAAADRAEERRDYAAKKDNSVCVSAVPEHEYGDNTAYSSNDSSSAIASLSFCFAIFTTRAIRLSTDSISAKINSRLITSISSIGFTVPETCVMFSSSKQRTTWQIASTSRM